MSPRPDPNSRSSISSSKVGPSLSHVSVTTPTDASSSPKQSISELILGQIDLAFVFITVNLVFLVSSRSRSVPPSDTSSEVSLCEEIPPGLSYSPPRGTELDPVAGSGASCPRMSDMAPDVRVSGPDRSFGLARRALVASSGRILLQDPNNLTSM